MAGLDLGIIGGELPSEINDLLQVVTLTPTNELPRYCRSSSVVAPERAAQRRPLPPLFVCLMPSRPRRKNGGPSALRSRPGSCKGPPRSRWSSTSF